MYEISLHTYIPTLIFKCEPHIGVATPELVIFSVEAHFSHSRSWPHIGIDASSSSDD